VTVRFGPLLPRAAKAASMRWASLCTRSRSAFNCSIAAEMFAIVGTLGEMIAGTNDPGTLVSLTAWRGTRLILPDCERGVWRTMKRLLLLLILAGVAWASDTTVTVKAVNMETSADRGGSTYTWHSMTVEVDGSAYKIGRQHFVRHETWLHKGTYTGRWKGRNKDTLEVDMPDGDKIRRVEFKVLGEE
jgi:hypothetical protein